MKRPILSAVLSTCALVVCGQAYRPMLVDGSRWGQMFMFEGGSSYVDRIEGDTLVNGVEYVIIRSSEYAYWDGCAALMREDSVERKVYYVDAMGAEHMLYDFGWPIGAVDTMYSTCESGSRILELDSISSQPPPGCLVSMPSPRFFYFSVVGGGHVVWLEGVDSIKAVKDPSWAFSPGDVENVTLHCHADGQGNIDFENTDLWPLDSCFEIRWWNAIPEHWNTPFQVFPNPTTDHVRIEWSNQMTISGDLTLLDALGNTLQQLKTKGAGRQTAIELSGYAPGMYLLLHRNENGTVMQSKIVKQ